MVDPISLIILVPAEPADRLGQSFLAKAAPEEARSPEPVASTDLCLKQEGQWDPEGWRARRELAAEQAKVACFSARI
jgi:hypothetical protein